MDATEKRKQYLREYYKEYYKTHAEQEKKRTNAYYWKHKEEMNKKRRERYARNPFHEREMAREYIKNKKNEIKYINNSL